MGDTRPAQVDVAIAIDLLNDGFPPYGFVEAIVEVHGVRSDDPETETSLYHKVILYDIRKSSIMSEQDIESAFDWLESPVIAVDVGLNFKLTGVVPKDFSSAGMTLGIRYLVKATNYKRSVDDVVSMVNGTIEGSMMKIADQLGGVTPFPTQRITEET